MRKRSHRRVFIRSVVLGLATGAVAVPAAQASAADSGVSTSYYRALELRSQGLNALHQTAYYRALELRSQGLNTLYQPTYNRALELRSQGLNTLYQPTVDRVSSADDRAGTHGVGVTTDPYASYDKALALRSQGLNELYEPTTVSADDRAGVRGPDVPVTTPVSVTSPSTGFDWTDAGIGAGSALLLIALLGGGLLVADKRTGKGQLAV